MKLSKKTLLTVVALGVFSLTACFGGEITNAAKLEYNKGIDYYNAGRYTQAAECFKKATEIDPNYIDAYYNLGSLFEYLDQDENALAAFKQIILRKPDDYESVYKAAELSHKLGFSDKAQMYLTLIPEDSIIGSQAKKLSHSIDSQLPKVDNTEPPEVEQNPQTDVQQQVQTEIQNPVQTNTNVVEQPQKPSEILGNGVYQNIPSPTGVVADKFGNLFVAGFSDNTIYKITPDGKQIVYIKDPKIDGPIGIAIDKNQNTYIANYNKNNVIKVESSGRVTEIITDIKQPYCMYISGDLLYVSSQGSNSVVRYRLYE